MYTIINRYFLNTSFSGGQELSLFLVTWAIFLGFSKVVSNKEDIAVTFLINKLSDFPYKIVQILLATLYILTSVWIMVRSYILMERQSGMSTEILSIPNSFFVLPVLILMIYITLHFVIELIELLILGKNRERREEN